MKDYKLNPFELAEHIIWAAHINDSKEDRRAVAYLLEDKKYRCSELVRVSEFCIKLSRIIQKELDKQ